MFIITGRFNGETVEDKLVSADELIDYFKLPIKGKQRAAFRLDEESPGIIAVRGGRKSFAHMRTVQCLINGIGPDGNSYTIQYYRTKTNRPATKNTPGYTDYQPKKLPFKGREASFDLVRQKEEAVLFCLTPMNGDSPFNNNSLSHFRFYDREAVAQSRLNEGMLYETVRDLILHGDDDKIMRIAKGIKIGRLMIPANETRTAVEAKVALIEMAKKHTKAVAAAINDDSTFTRGLVNDAVESHVIKLISAGGNARAWVWSEGGTQIMRVSKQQNPREALYDHVSIPENFAQFRSRVDMLKGIGGQDAPAQVEANLDDPVQLINAAIESKVITFNPEESKVYILNERRQIDGRAIGKIEDGANWKSEAANFSPPQLGRIKKAVEARMETV